MKILIAIVISVVLMAIYVTWGRNWLKEKPWAWSKRYFAWIEPIEIVFWKKSETILWSRFLIIAGLLPPLLDQIKALNVPEVLAIIPVKWVPYVSLSFTLCGIISEMLRRETSKPLEVVALPEIVSPAVAAAVIKSEHATASVVAVVEKEKTDAAIDQAKTETPTKE